MMCRASDGPSNATREMECFEPSWIVAVDRPRVAGWKPRINRADRVGEAVVERAGDASAAADALYGLDRGPSVLG